jgi:hypothetical protein
MEEDVSMVAQLYGGPVSEREQHLERKNEFYFICNTIHSILTQPPVNYLSLSSILQNSIGLNTTLNTLQMAYVLHKVNFFKNTFLGVVIKSKNNKSDNFINDSIDILKITLNNIIRHIEELEYDLTMFKEENINRGLSYTPIQGEKKEEGTSWVRTLFDIYLKYGGNKGVYSIEFFNSIKDNWEKLEDYETIEISYITDNILGGVSLEYISTNFLIWLRNNNDVLDLKYRFIIKLMG